MTMVKAQTTERTLTWEEMEPNFVDKRHLLASMSTLSSVSSVTLLGAAGACPDSDSLSCASMPGVAFPQGLPDQHQEADVYMNEMRRNMSSTPVAEINDVMLVKEGENLLKDISKDLRACTNDIAETLNESLLPAVNEDTDSIMPVHWLLDECRGVSPGSP